MDLVLPVAPPDERAPEPDCRRPAVAFLVAALPLSLRTFQYFPGMGPVQEAWFVLVVLGLLAAFLPWRLRLGVRPRGFELYLLGLVAIIPVQAALAAQAEFGQPLLYGLLAHRGLALVLGLPMLTWMALERDLIRPAEVERALVILAWGTMGLYLAMNLLLRPEAYLEGAQTGFVSNPREGASFVFDVAFIVFGFFHYAFQALRAKGRYPYFKMSAFFLFLMLVFRGRSLLVALVGAYLILAMRWSKDRDGLLRRILGITLFASLGLAGLYLLKPDLFATLFAKFSDAFTVVFTGEQTDDISANARLEQVLVAMPYLEKNWLFGSGLLSNQWDSGFKSALGYFHPTDIGILGVVFQYGVVGALLYLAQFRFAYRCAREAPGPDQPGGHLVQTLKGYLLFLAFRSLATGQFVFAAETSLFLISLLWTLGAGKLTLVDPSRASGPPAIPQAHEGADQPGPA